MAGLSTWHRQTYLKKWTADSCVPHTAAWYAKSNLKPNILSAGHVALITHTCIRTRDNLYIAVLTVPYKPGPPHCRVFMDTLRHTTVGRTLLNGWSTLRRDLYLTTYNTHKRQTSMPPVGFEPEIPGSEQPKTHSPDRAATVVALSFYCN